MNSTRDDKGCYIVDLDGIPTPFDFSMLVIDQMARSKGWESLTIDEIFSRLLDKPTYGDAIAFFKMALNAAWQKHKKKEAMPTDAIISDNYYNITKAAFESMVVFFKKNGMDITAGSKKNDEAEEKKD